jgi:hypothetical protein
VSSRSELSHNGSAPGGLRRQGEKGKRLASQKAGGTFLFPAALAPIEEAEPTQFAVETENRDARECQIDIAEKSARRGQRTPPQPKL